MPRRSVLKMSLGAVLTVLSGLNKFWGLFRSIDWLKNNYPSVSNFLVTDTFQISITVAGISLLGWGVLEILKPSETESLDTSKATSSGSVTGIGGGRAVAVGSVRDIGSGASIHAGDIHNHYHGPTPAPSVPAMEDASYGAPAIAIEETETPLKVPDSILPEEPMFEEDTPIIICLMPRGFILLDHLTSEPSWAIQAHYFDYDGNGKGSTYYYESDDSPGGTWEDLRVQYHKLQIPPGDHELAYRALRLIMEIREGRYTLSPDGRILASGGVEVPLPPFAEVRLSGPTARPSLPAKLSPLSASGPLRDLLADLSYLANNNPKNAGHGFDRTYEDVRKRIAEIRREARIEVHQLLGDSHPAAKNLEEIVVRYKPDQEAELSAWTAEFSASVAEAARSVEIMSSRNRPTGQ